MFIRNIEDLEQFFESQKCKLVHHLKKNYKEGVHYIKDITYKNIQRGRGGQNRDCYLLTEACFELLKNSFNLRSRYITSISGNVKCVNIAMSIENSTIGFIVNSLQGLVDMKRQQKFDKYKVDLYFPAYKLIVECDEDNHRDRNPEDEKVREEFLVSLGNTMIRFNPSDNSFDLSDVLRKINVILWA
jgi:very-short-patch-repair endonuclease